MRGTAGDLFSCREYLATFFRDGNFRRLVFVTGMSGDLFSWQEVQATCFGGNFGRSVFVAGILGDLVLVRIANESFQTRDRKRNYLSQ